MAGARSGSDHVVNKAKRDASPIEEKDSVIKEMASDATPSSRGDGRNLRRRQKEKCDKYP